MLRRNFLKASSLLAPLAAMASTTETNEEKDLSLYEWAERENKKIVLYWDNNICWGHYGFQLYWGRNPQQVQQQCWGKSSPLYYPVFGQKHQYLKDTIAEHLQHFRIFGHYDGIRQQTILHADFVVDDLILRSEYTAFTDLIVYRLSDFDSAIKHFADQLANSLIPGYYNLDDQKLKDHWLDSLKLQYRGGRAYYAAT